jgi:hypothetical protein
MLSPLQFTIQAGRTRCSLTSCLTICADYPTLGQGLAGAAAAVMLAGRAFAVGGAEGVPAATA